MCILGTEYFFGHWIIEMCSCKIYLTVWNCMLQIVHWCLTDSTCWSPDHWFQVSIPIWMQLWYHSKDTACRSIRQTHLTTADSNKSNSDRPSQSGEEWKHALEAFVHWSISCYVHPSWRSEHKDTITSFTSANWMTNNQSIHRPRQTQIHYSSRGTSRHSRHYKCYWYDSDCMRFIDKWLTLDSSQSSVKFIISLYVICWNNGEYLCKRKLFSQADTSTTAEANIAQTTSYTALSLAEQEPTATTTVTVILWVTLSRQIMCLLYQCKWGKNSCSVYHSQQMAFIVRCMQSH